MSAMTFSFTRDLNAILPCRIPRFIWTQPNSLLYCRHQSWEWQRDILYVQEDKSEYIPLLPALSHFPNKAFENIMYQTGHCAKMCRMQDAWSAFIHIVCFIFLSLPPLTSTEVSFIPGVALSSKPKHHNSGQITEILVPAIWCSCQAASGMRLNLISLYSGCSFYIHDKSEQIVSGLGKNTNERRQQKAT